MVYKAQTKCLKLEIDFFNDSWCLQENICIRQYLMPSCFQCPLGGPCQPVTDATQLQMPICAVNSERLRSLYLTIEMERKSTIEFCNPKSNIRLQEARRTLRRLMSDPNTQTNLANTLQSPNSLKIAKTRARLLLDPWIAKSSEDIIATASPIESLTNPNDENILQIGDGDSGSSTTGRTNVPLAEEADTKSKQNQISANKVSSSLENTKDPEFFSPGQTVDDPAMADKAPENGLEAVENETYISKFCKWISNISNRWIILFHFGVFALSSVLYNLGLEDDGRATFKNWADYFNSFAPHLGMSSLILGFLGTLNAKWNEAQKMFLCTSRPVELFNNALRRDIPGRHEKLEEFAKYIPLMWVLFVREMSPAFLQKVNLTYVQHSLRLSDSQMEALEKESKFLHPALVIYDWLTDLIEDMEDMSMFQCRGKDTGIKDAVYNLKSSCETVSWASKASLVSDPMFFVCYIVLHLYGWTGVLGWYSESAKTYYPSPFWMFYYLFVFFFDIGKINFNWFHYCGLRTVPSSVCSSCLLP